MCRCQSFITALSLLKQHLIDMLYIAGILYNEEPISPNKNPNDYWNQRLMMK